MSSPIRIRPTALILKDDAILLVEYTDEHGIHYNLPGGGVEPGETLKEGVRREVFEETRAEVDVGPLAFVYEYAPHLQSGDYDSPTPSIHLIFECYLKEGSVPHIPDTPDLNQSAVKWVALNELDAVLLYPNIKKEIWSYRTDRKTIDLLEDYQLDSYSKKRSSTAVFIQDEIDAAEY
ncbi:NUDIX domain-containing protein [Paenibacillus athensensis]|uniref:NUDIX hydrolase n=1 Tax=Paenibacillus athensensis TaxID=1967502 RepID=A0A4Y8Q8Y3_9BACL|nr:NUDIX domain-containing protein [Paenibacillus athensensis]MCD1260237.1 NUDIX domain-containing protein [Paenibacillus athensensis]